MSTSAFIDKSRQPTEKEIVSALSSAYPNWVSMLSEIRKIERTQEDFKYMYGKPYGWAIRFRVRGKLLASLYPNQNHFLVQIILNPKQLDEAQEIQLHPNAKEAIQKANPYPEGKWLFIKVEGKRDMEDIRELLKLKTRKV